MPHVLASPPRRAARSRGPLHLLIALVLALGSVLVASPLAYAEDPGEFLDMSKTVQGFEDGEVVEPGDTFVYTITFSCTNIGSGGCTSAQLVDALPEGISLNDSADDISITPAGAGTATATGDDITIDFTQPLTDPVGGQGILDGQSIQIQIPVVVDEDISPELDGQDLTNTATVDGTNTAPASDDFTVVPNVPTDLVATTDKAFDPAAAVADPGTQTTMTLTGGSDSNVPVDEIIITDPNDPPGPPGAFEYLGLTGELTIDLPAGAEQVQVDCYVDGAWVDGTPATEATLPASVEDPADCQGVRVHFISTDDDGIPPGASGSIDIGLEQRDTIAEAGEGPITNEVSTVVVDGGDTSDPVTADDDYTIQSGDIALDATKTFSPDLIAAGSTSTVTIGATNSSDRTLDTLSITEPGGDPNMFTSGLTFSGWGDVQWPSGATGASVEFSYANPPSPVTESTTTPNTLPDPTPGRTVTGFTVTFTGPIVPGAEASIPFTVTADDEQAADSVEHPNTIDADSTAPGGYSGDATAEDTLTTLVKRIAIDTGKAVLPGQIFSIPGQEVLVELSGTLADFPTSTTDANDIIIQEPADLDDDWFDTFTPTGVVNTPIPAGATLTVQYWDGDEWVDVPTMVDLAGPQVFTGDFPPDVQDNAEGIRFVYHSDTGFPPGTEVNPNLIFQLLPEAAGQDITIDDCASSSAAADDADPAAGDPACDDIVIVPPDPGNADFIDKAWDDPAVVGERTQQEHGATIGWSTSGAVGIDQMVISDIPDPSVAGLPGSAFDSFDLVRIDPITAALDPRLQYDQITGVELYSLAAGGWIDAPDDPCPAECDMTFPGYELSSASQADTIAFRLTYAESPTRVADDPAAPPIGSGVAVSVGNSRQLHPVFRIRDELRSDPNDPVLAADLYNVAGEAGVVRNTAQARLVVDDNDDYYHEDAADDIVITPINVTADITKDWTGGPMGVPTPDTAVFPDEYPTGTVTLQGRNTTPRVVDRLTISEPAAGTDPFENFNLAGFTTITDPATIGATDLTITLNLAGGGIQTMTRDEALAATEADLADVVGFTVVYEGRIASNGTAVVTFLTRLRDGIRSDPGTPVAAPQTVQDVASVEAADLVDYDGVEPDTSTDADDASIDLQPAGIDLEVTKTIAPDSQTEPDDSPVDVTLTGQPAGPSRTVWMRLTDADTTFFNAYDFVGFGTFGFTDPIDQVQVDAYVGGTFTAAGGTVVRTGGAWVDGVPGTSLVLPAGVTADQVQGLRFTFTRADGGIWENPSTPTQTVVFQVQRRAELRSGGPVRSDLAGNAPNPGEDSPGETSDTIQGDNQAADTTNGDPLTGHDEATDTILYRHADNAITVTKSPTGAQPPGVTIDYELTFTNTGDVAITDPVITDSWESDADGPLLVYDPDRAGPGIGYTFALTGDPAPEPPNGPAMPTDPTQVTITETASSIQFTFPAGTVLEPGQTYTITTPLQFRPGLPGDTEVTNTTGITGDRAWDECTDTLDPDSGQCEANTLVYPTRAGALRGVKSVRAVDDELGVLDTRGTGCAPDDDGFYVGGCVPVTKPGEDVIWRMTFTNTGNLPQDKVYAIDRLPTPGDTGAISTLERGSQWTPIPQSLTYAGVSDGTVDVVRVYYDTDEDLCTLDLETLDGCPDGEWTLVEEIDNPQVGGTIDLPPTATAILIETDFAPDGMLQPTGTLTVDLTTTAPAQSPTAGADTVAWNTVAAAAETDDDGTRGLAPRSEGNKVGAALATGPLEIQKVVTGPAADFAPGTFVLTVACTSAGEAVDLGDDATITVTPDEPYLIEDLPWGSECTVTEDLDAAGNPDFSATTVTVGRDTDDPVRIVATNTYQLASLSIDKEVEGSAVDANGDPLTYGPFTFTVDCTFPDADTPVYAVGYGPGTPMVATFDSDDPPVTFTRLPAGAECTATEIDTDGAETTTSEATTADTEVPITGDTTIDLVLTPDGDDPVVTNTVTFTNTFATGAVTITKEVTGPGAETYGAGPFTVHLACTDAEDGRTVYDGDQQLSDTNGNTVTITDLYVDSTCEVTETGTGGATSSTVSPDGAFLVTADSGENPVVVTVTNAFDVGSLRVIKKITGDVSQVGDDQLFWFQLSCQLMVDGQPQPVPIENDGAFNLSSDGGLTQTFDGLPTGALCTITETDDGGADNSVIEPGQVTIGDATTIDVLATNTFDPPPDDPDDSGSENGSGSGEGRLPNTGGPSLIFLTVGLALLIAGASALRVSRRRRS